MDNRIDRPGTGLSPTGIRMLDQPAQGGHGRAVVERPGLTGGGRQGESPWRINVAGPFDPNAPRGTYLDIVV